MPHLRVALLGCGNVGRALLTMVAEKADDLRERAQSDADALPAASRARRAAGSRPMA